MSKFNELSHKEVQKLIDSFVNSLVQGLRVSNLTKEETIYISDSLIEKFGNKPIAVEKLTEKVKDEILTNYKQYYPFCLASILTAYRKLQ